jgi:hypothetical protein
MKAITFLLPAVLFFASYNVSHDQEVKTFKHPELNFSFKATGEWKNNPYHKDKMIYEMVNPKTGIHVLLWYTGGTESTCDKYLVKMADMKGLNFAEPVKKRGDREPVWVLTCTGAENDAKIVNILAALSYKEKYGKDAPERCQGESFNAIHIAQVWCPAKRYDENKKMMQDIISSLALAE